MGGGAWCTNLSAAYALLASQLRSTGLVREEIEASSRAFSFGTARPQPNFYADAPWRLPSAAVRVLALPLADPLLAQSKELPRLLARAARAVEAALPRGSIAWTQPTATLHATIFHPGMSPGSLTPATATIAPARAPSPTDLARELEKLRQIAAMGADGRGNLIDLVVDRIVMSSGGVLLVLLAPAEGCGADGVSNAVERMRAAASAAFPDAGRKQAKLLIHSSVLRLIRLPRDISADELRDTAKRIGVVCEHWAGRLQGARVAIRGLLYVVEEQIMTLAGEQHKLWFGSTRTFEQDGMQGAHGQRVLSAGGQSGRRWAANLTTRRVGCNIGVAHPFASSKSSMP